MKRFFLYMITFYKKFISPIKPPSCRFTPTCSVYAYKSIEKFGVLKGSFLSLKRILKCNPFFKGGEDPVPENFSFFIKRNDNNSRGSVTKWKDF